jgi:hypothetical protein
LAGQLRNKLCSGKAAVTEKGKIMNIASLIVHLVSGVAGGIVGGSLVGSIKPEYNLGTLRNSIAGIVGGGLVGFVYNTMSKVSSAANGGGTDMFAILFGMIGGGMGGLVMAGLCGIVKSRLAKT